MSRRRTSRRWKPRTDYGDSRRLALRTARDDEARIDEQEAGVGEEDPVTGLIRCMGGRWCRHRAGTCTATRTDVPQRPTPAVLPEPVHGVSVPPPYPPLTPTPEEGPDGGDAPSPPRPSRWHVWTADAFDAYAGPHWCAPEDATGHRLCPEPPTHRVDLPALDDGRPLALAVCPTHRDVALADLPRVLAVTPIEGDDHDHA